MIPIPVRYGILIAAVIAVVIALIGAGPIPQPVEYHRMADVRPLGPLPNALNVLSNIPFMLVGLWGIAVILGRAGRAPTFDDPWVRRSYVALFAGVAVTTAGSWYYHLAPDHWRLVWDRLPMTVGFSGLLVATIAERLRPGFARPALIPFLILGMATVFHWYWTETQQAGDLRVYLLLQIGTLVVVALSAMLFPSRARGAGYLLGAFLLYAAAKVLEGWDARIFAMGHVVSGHTLKHIVAAMAVGQLAMMLHARGCDGGDLRTDR